MRKYVQTRLNKQTRAITMKVYENLKFTPGEILKLFFAAHLFTSDRDSFSITKRVEFIKYWQTQRRDFFAQRERETFYCKFTTMTTCTIERVNKTIKWHLTLRRRRVMSAI